MAKNLDVYYYCKNGTKVVTSFYNNFKQIIMNNKLLLLAILVTAFSSCTTLYKSGQTPDDVYYSPARPVGVTEVRNDRRNDDRRYDNRDYATQYNYESAIIRMGIYDPRWRYLDDYSYSPYNYGFNHGYYYNPYYWPYPVYSPVFLTPSNPKVTTPRMNNLGAYGSTTGFTNTTPTLNHSNTTIPTRRYNNSNNGSAFGNAIRQVLGANNDNNSNSGNSNNSNNNTRSYTPSTNTNSSTGSRPASSSSSGGGAVSRPARNGGN
ncbi:MAG: hypothetical protein ABIP10_09690 [Ferruginibacter sp.]